MSTEIKAVTHTEKVIAGEVDAVTHLEKVIAKYSGGGGGGGGFTPTDAQLTAMNSGIDSTKVQQISTNENNISTCKEFTDNATIDSNRKLYISATEPTGNIPEGSTWINGKEIKTYTVSNNLLNQTVDPENIYITASIRRMGYDVQLPAGTYSIYGNDATLYAKTKIDGVYGDAVQISEAQTLTLANDGSILVYCSTVGEFPNVNIMLNVGSQILPYEPYGSTWS